ncbi:MAG: MaoC family dehydratase [Cohaesibacteraceae bacterium]|nr:MaoC family dehydratase [Cohaesibacteraceae bacterium]MBL4875465.1 MaoC family dehydratase [Cohaesibacteraceae bacterium]
MKYLDDFTIGQSIQLGTTTVTKQDVLEFASEFDPQPFHLDEEAGLASMLGGLAASGWHSCALTMRLMCDALFLKGEPLGSPGVEKLRWMAPVFPGDTLTGKLVVENVRKSNSKPDRGFVTLCANVEKSDGTKVLNMNCTVIYPVQGADR